MDRALAMLEQGDRVARVWRRLSLAQTTRCWLWGGAKTTAGYGQVQIAGRRRYVHRLVYEWFSGLIPDGLDLDHLCRTRHCANPKHLEPVTPRINVLRGCGITAENARATHCKRGHAKTPENTYIRPDGWGACKPCKAMRKRGEI